MKARAFQMTSSALSGSAESYRGWTGVVWKPAAHPLRPGVANGVRTNWPDRADAWGWSSVFFMGPLPPGWRLDPLTADVDVLQLYFPR